MAGNTEWAAEKASAAMRYLADSYPECSASPKLHSHQDATYVRRPGGAV